MRPIPVRQVSLIVASALLCILAMTMPVNPTTAATIDIEPPPFGDSTVSIKVEDTVVPDVDMAIDLSPLLSFDPLGYVQTLVSELVKTVTGLLCAITQDETVCALKILSYRIQTDYVKPNGTHVKKTIGATVNQPMSIDVTGDSVPDVYVKLAAVSTSNVWLTVTKLNGLLVPKQLPLSIEALVNDPSTPGRVINVGYDARDSYAPIGWQANAAILVGTAVEVDATVTTDRPGPTLTTIGGIYTEGQQGQRINQQRARLTYTPVPARADVAFRLGKESQSGRLSSQTASKVDLDLLLEDGQDVDHVTATLNKLRLPVDVLLNYLDALEVPTSPEAGNLHAQMLTHGDVGEALFGYESTSAGNTDTRIRMRMEDLPGRTDFFQKPTGIVVDTSAPIGLVEGGIATRTGFGSLPAGAPFELADASYVHHDTGAITDATTFRVAGVEHVLIRVTGQPGAQEILVGGRLASTGMRVLMTEFGTAGDTTYDAFVDPVPHSFKVRLAFADVQIVSFCGSANDDTDPCSPQGQADPQGIDRITLTQAHNPAGLVAGLTDLSGSIEGIPSVFDLDVTTHKPSSETDPDQNTSVHIDTDNPVDLITLRGHGTGGLDPALPADPEEDTLIYSASPAQLGLRLHQLEHAQFDTEPDVVVVLVADGDRDLSFNLDLPGNIASRPNIHQTYRGKLFDRPARTRFTLKGGDGEPTEVLLETTNQNNVPVHLPRVEVRAAGFHSLTVDLVQTVRLALDGVPAWVQLRIEPTVEPDGSTGVNVLMDTYEGQPIDVLDVRMDSGWEPAADYRLPIPDDEGGAIVVMGEDSAVDIPRHDTIWMHARVHRLRNFELSTSPQVEALLDAIQVQRFHLYINTGMGDDITYCEDDDAEEHNLAHLDWHDVVIDGLQPNTRFSFVPADNGRTDLCERRTGRVLDYQASGRAEQIEYRGSVGDMALLRGRVGNPQQGIKAPKHLQICQAGFDLCLQEANWEFTCSAHQFCDSDDARTSLYLETFGERSNFRLEYCELNDRTPDPIPGAEQCDRAQAQAGIFANLDLEYLAFAFVYSKLEEGSGQGFLAMNTTSHATGQSTRASGWLKKLDLDSIGKFINLNIAADQEYPNGSLWDHYMMPFQGATKNMAYRQGDVHCVDWQLLGDVVVRDEMTYLRAILDSPTAEPDDAGANITPILCDTV